jgi:hypothetical protein
MTCCSRRRWTATVASAAGVAVAPSAAASLLAVRAPAGGAATSSSAKSMTRSNSWDERAPPVIEIEIGAAQQATAVFAHRSSGGRPRRERCMADGSARQPSFVTHAGDVPDQIRLVSNALRAVTSINRLEAVGAPLAGRRRGRAVTSLDTWAPTGHARDGWPRASGCKGMSFDIQPFSPPVAIPSVVLAGAQPPVRRGTKVVCALILG